LVKQCNKKSHGYGISISDDAANPKLIERLINLDFSFQKLDYKKSSSQFIQFELLFYAHVSKTMNFK
jgi:hypothetical protein